MFCLDNIPTLGITWVYYGKPAIVYLHMTANRFSLEKHMVDGNRGHIKIGLFVGGRQKRLFIIFCLYIVTQYILRINKSALSS